MVSVDFPVEVPVFFFGPVQIGELLIDYMIVENFLRFFQDIVHKNLNSILVYFTGFVYLPQKLFFPFQVAPISVAEVLGNSEIDFVEDPAKLGVRKEGIALKELVENRSEEGNKMAEIEVGCKAAFDFVFEVVSGVEVVELEDEVQEMVVLDDQISVWLFVDVLKIGQIWCSDELFVDSVPVVVNVVAVNIMLPETNN